MPNVETQIKRDGSLESLDQLVPCFKRSRYHVYYYWNTPRHVGRGSPYLTYWGLKINNIRAPVITTLLKGELLLVRSQILDTSGDTGSQISHIWR